MTAVRRWIHILCMLLLPLGQHAALAHAAQHYAPQVPAPAPQSQLLDGGDAVLQLAGCELHGLYAQVLGGACTAEGEPFLFLRPDAIVLEGQSARIRPDLPAHRSRGPPLLS